MFQNVSKIVGVIWLSTILLIFIAETKLIKWGHGEKLQAQLATYSDFRDQLCKHLCGKQPPEGGTLCKCDQHPLG